MVMLMNPHYAGGLPFVKSPCHVSLMDEGLYMSNTKFNG